MIKKRKWWGLMFGTTGLDGDAGRWVSWLNLYRTKEDALNEAAGFDRPPKPVKITIVVEDKGK